MTDWHVQGTCRDLDPELFFPEGTTGHGLLQQAEAKSVCRRCPVQAECRTAALNSREEYGVWGGTSEHQRQRMLRGPGRTRPGRTDLEPEDVQLVLYRLDNLHSVAEVALDAGLSQQLCHAIWRRYRPGSLPPANRKNGKTAAA